MSQLLSQVAVGTIVKINENGSPINYIVVNQGIPSNSNLYDVSCNGAWLLRQDIAESRAWGSENKTLESSDIQSYLNNTWINRYDTDIQNAIKQVKIPYRQYGGALGIDQYGANGLSCKIFLLSGREVGFSTSDNPYFPNDGAKLSYFESGTGSSALNKRIAKLNGSARNWWLRSPYTGNTASAYFVFSNGNWGNVNCTSLYGIRPALVLPFSLVVTDDGTIYLSDPPTAPGSITLGSIIVGSPLQITWTASTDSDGTIASYTLERNVNQGGWTQVFSGNALTYSDTIGEDWGTVAYRVCAVDNLGVTGPYTTSDTEEVQNGVLYITGPSNTMGLQKAPFDFNITVNLTGSAPSTQPSLEVTLDSMTLYSNQVTLGQQNSINIDVRSLDGGTHTIVASAMLESYIPASETYTFSTQEISWPSEGIGVQFQSQESTPMFPQTVASLVKGLYGESVGGNLSKLTNSVLFNRTKVPKYQDVTVDLSTAQEGDIVRLPENGVIVDFYVAKHNYESGLNSAGRTLLVRKEYYGGQSGVAWNSTEANTYANGTIDTWLNGDYKALLPEAVQTGMGTTKFYYTPGNNNNTVTALERAVFLLSLTEYGLSSSGMANTEGSVLPTAGILLPYPFSSTVLARWTRTPVIAAGYRARAFWVNYDNTFGHNSVTSALAPRPAFTLPANFTYTYYVGPDGIHDAQEYIDAGTLTDYFGNSVPVVNIETGSYTGTGQSGQATPNTLTFNFEPKFLYVSAVDQNINSGLKAYYMVVSKGVSYAQSEHHAGNQPSASCFCNIVWGDNSVSWYNTGNRTQTEQLNQINTNYCYIAIG